MMSLIVFTLIATVVIMGFCIYQIYDILKIHKTAMQILNRKIGKLQIKRKTKK